MDNLLVRVGLGKALFLIDTVIKDLHTVSAQKGGGLMKIKTALNCAYLTSPQLNHLAITTTFINKTLYLSEPVGLINYKNKEVFTVKIKELG